MDTPPLLPFNAPFFTGREFAYVEQAIRNLHFSGDGPFTHRCERLLEEMTGAPRVLLTTSCTHALEMAALLLDIGPDDEVIVPSFTFVSTVNAFVLRGAKPVFADVRPDTLNLDADDVAAKITERTRAIVPVHYAGIGCDMERLSSLARDCGAAIVEDNAHGLLGRYRDRPLGGFGQLATQSFHETKNFSCGEGGALVINDPALVERAEILREKGTNRARFFRGEVDKYTWVDVGSSYVPSDLLAAFLFAQLESAEAIQTARRNIWERYDRELAAWAEEQGVQRPTIPPGREQAYHLYYLLLPTAADRQAFIAHLRSRGVHAVFHYLPLNVSPKGLELGGTVGGCPVTEDVAERLVRLPLFNAMTADQQGRAIAATLEFETA